MIISTLIHVCYSKVCFTLVFWVPRYNIDNKTTRTSPRWVQEINIHRRSNAPNPKLMSATARTLGDIDDDPEDEPGTGRKCEDSVFCCAADSYTHISKVGE